MNPVIPPTAHAWDVTPSEARALQRQLAGRVIVAGDPADVRHVAGVDISVGPRGSNAGRAAVVVLEWPSLRPVEQSIERAEVRFPYVPGLLSFRELPVLAAVWERLEERPDVLIFDGQGIAHPRRFGLACHGGVLFDIPSIGCAKSLLVGTHGPLGVERGATAELVHRGEVVGMAVRTRTGVSPVYVSIGHLMDLPTAVDLVLRMTAGFREPETTRRSHRLVNDLRRGGGADGQ